MVFTVKKRLLKTSPWPPTYSKSVLRTMIFTCIYERTTPLIHLCADSCKNHFPYIAIHRKSVARTMLPIYPDDYIKLSFQVLLKAIFLTTFTVNRWSERWCLSSSKLVSDRVEDSNWTEFSYKMYYLKEFESQLSSHEAWGLIDLAAEHMAKVNFLMS